MGKWSREEWDLIGEHLFGKRLRGMMPQGIHEASATRKYVLGSRLQLDDRVFRYALAGGTLNTDLGAKNALAQHIAYTTVAASVAAGSTLITLDVAAGDGVNTDGEIGANELAGGFIVVFPHAENSFVRKIISNTATVVGGGEMAIAVDKPIPVALTVDIMHGECMASPYLNVQSLADAISSVIGIPTVAATVGQYLWLQTWGPIWIAPQGEVSLGNNNRQVVFRHDGGIDEYDAADPNTIKAQHAGFVLANAPGGGQGAAFIFLQIAP